MDAYERSPKEIELKIKLNRRKAQQKKRRKQIIVVSVLLFIAVVIMLAVAINAAKPKPYLIYKENGLYGLLADDGKKLCDARYSQIGEESEGAVSVCADGRYGWITTKGEVLIAAQYHETGYFSEGLAPVRLGSKWGYINKRGAYAISPQFDTASDFSDGFAVTSADGKYRFIKTDGKSLTDHSFENARAFAKNGLAAVKLGGKWGFIDKKGKTVIECKYDDVSDFWENELAAVTLGGSVGVINDKGETVITPQYTGIEPYSDGEGNYDPSVLCIYNSDKAGLCDKSGKLLLPATVFYSARTAAEGVYCVYDGEKWLLVDGIGAQIGNVTSERELIFHDGLALFEDGGRLGYTDINGNAVIDAMYGDATPFENKRATVCADGKYGVMDNAGAYIIPPQFELLCDGGEIKYIYKQNGLYGYCNDKGEPVITARYTHAEPFVDGKAVVCENGDYYVINKKGKQLSEDFLEIIRP